MKPDDLVRVWSRLLGKSGKSWVLFENGTCVVLVKPQADLRAHAVGVLKEWGPVHAGSPAGDFSVTSLTEIPGWVVTCHHPDVLTYVEPDLRGGSSGLTIGLTGRSRRDADASTLNVIHVEDRRNGVTIS